MNGSSFAGAFFGSLLGNGKVVRWLLGRGLIVTGSTALVSFLWFQRQPWPVRAVIITILVCGFVILITRSIDRRAKRRSRKAFRHPAFVPPPPLEDRPHFLYRWWGPNDRLLYVGITNDLERRTGEHAAEKPWIAEAVGATVETFPSRSAALAAEERAIFSENPVYNVIHNYGWER